jgi:hypothetical protein
MCSTPRLSGHIDRLRQPVLADAERDQEFLGEYLARVARIVCGSRRSSLVVLVMGHGRW